MIHKLKSGNCFEIDEGDLPFVKAHKINLMNRKDDRTKYVVVRDKKTCKYKGLLHNLLLKCPKGKMVDHIDGNGLNNKRSNLRIVTPAQNQWNRRSHQGNVKGVRWREERQKWSARITINKKIIHLGLFEKRKDAVKARLEAEEKYHKEYANLEHFKNA